MASGAAAVIAKARRDLQHEFFSRDAVSPDKSIAFDPTRHVERRVFERWQRMGIIKTERDGRFWLDVVAYDVDLRSRHNRLKAVLLFIIAALTLGLVFGLLSSSHS